MTVLKVYLKSNLESHVPAICLKIYEQNEGKIILLTNNMEQSEFVSNKLWTFKKSSFLPSDTKYDSDIFIYVTNEIQNIEKFIFPNIILFDLVLSDSLSNLIVRKNFKSICSFHSSEHSINSSHILQNLAQKHSVKTNIWEFQQSEKKWIEKT